MPFKAVIEIDNVDDYLKVNERVKIEQPLPVTRKERLRCPFCGGYGLELIAQNSQRLYYNSVKETNEDSQQRDLHCKDCGGFHSRHKSELGE